MFHIGGCASVWQTPASATQPVVFNLGITWQDTQSLPGKPTLSWGSSERANSMLKVWASTADRRSKEQ